MKKFVEKKNKQLKSFEKEKILQKKKRKMEKSKAKMVKQNEKQ